jgi:hypothetical protein
MEAGLEKVRGFLILSLLYPEVALMCNCHSSLLQTEDPAPIVLASMLIICGLLNAEKAMTRLRYLVMSLIWYRILNVDDTHRSENCWLELGESGNSQMSLLELLPGRAPGCLSRLQASLVRRLRVQSLACLALLNFRSLSK